ncbi:PemK domain-containing protein [Microbacterium sp. SZ1]|uniref:type II toxin-antitoxin system PemK/MazF family toxin n=1 Tax=Microbacterium sp. SZ1 TaxID=1849736 RepID=UPI000BBC7C43|nr:type II toxin-antitoxin system PemK/MazF family toxin [Microbacterium sp. SZ1]PCE13893.1 PemK domain-containing protein [Microbacterium sp. SZ1]
MSNGNGILNTLSQILIRAFGSNRASRTTTRPRGPVARVRSSAETGGAERRARGTDAVGAATVRIDADRVVDLRLDYAPDRDGAPDAGEIIWTWVPYEENDGRGKDRPLLVIGRQSANRVYAVRMTSRPHDGDRDYLSIGAGEWDSQRRESWVDIEQLYSVHETGLRREAAVLDRTRYGRVTAALSRRYGWTDG